MKTPGLIQFAEAVAYGPGSTNDIFNEGFSGFLGAEPLRFYVIVPGVGACQVPQEAISHLQALEPSYVARNLTEHWSGTVVPEWTVTVDRLWVLEEDWNRRVLALEEFGELLSASEQERARLEPAAPQPNPIDPSARTITSLRGTVKRQDAMRPLVARAMEECERPNDPYAVMRVLVTYAAQKPPPWPMTGVVVEKDGGAIEWYGQDKGKKTLDIRSLRGRIAGLRKEQNKAG